MAYTTALLSRVVSNVRAPRFSIRYEGYAAGRVGSSCTWYTERNGKLVRLCGTINLQVQVVATTYYRDIPTSKYILYE